VNTPNKPTQYKIETTASFATFAGMKGYTSVGLGTGNLVDKAKQVLMREIVVSGGHSP